MPDTIRIEVRKGDPGTPDRTNVIVNGRDVTSSVYMIDLVMRDALEPGAPCDRAFVNHVPYPVTIRRGPKIRPGTPGTDHLDPGDLIVIADSPAGVIAGALQ